MFHNSSGCLYFLQVFSTLHHVSQCRKIKTRSKISYSRTNLPMTIKPKLCFSRFLPFIFQIVNFFKLFSLMKVFGCVLKRRKIWHILTLQGCSHMHFSKETSINLKQEPCGDKNEIATCSFKFFCCLCISPSCGKCRIVRVSAHCQYRFSLISKFRHYKMVLLRLFFSGLNIFFFNYWAVPISSFESHQVKKIENSHIPWNSIDGANF